MEKRAVVEVGKTPSELSGRKSASFVRGQALAYDEEPDSITVEDLAKKAFVETPTNVQ
jgi:hypothetical protein